MLPKIPASTKIYLLLFGLALIHQNIHAQKPDDSAAAREAAITRLKASNAAPCKACSDDMVLPFGSNCNSREFSAPAILEPPKKVWELNPGWWGVWPPLVSGNLILTGSCNNDGNEGLSAIDKNTGKMVWRIGSLCAIGNRRGTPGFVTFYQLSATEIALVYPRDDGGTTELYVVNTKTGKIVRTIPLPKKGNFRYRGGINTFLAQNTKEKYSYIIAYNADMTKQLWENKNFALAMPDKLDPRYKPTFAQPAAAGGLLLQTARTKGQAEPATRQLHAIDIKTGQSKWIHKEQPITVMNNKTVADLSDDGIPMVVDNKVVIRMQGLAGSVGMGNYPYGEGLRALDLQTGKILWTTKPQAKQEVVHRVGACGFIVVEMLTGKEREIWCYRMADGKKMWNRPVAKNARLLCSSGGAFYVGERITDGEKFKESKLQGFDAETGTLLWTASVPEHSLDISIEPSWDIESPRGGTPTWTIDKDGAIYGVTLRGVFKMK